jgi:hypothetical protein
MTSIAVARPLFLLTMTLLLLIGVIGRAGSPTADAVPPGAPLPPWGDYPWLYRREGVPSLDAVVEVLLVGDVMLGRGVAAEADPLGDVAWLQTADLAIANFEGVIAAPGAGLAPPGYDLRMPPTAAAQLRQAGFDVVGLANNHTLDLGPAGLAETAAHLTAAGLNLIGAGPGWEAAFQPLLLTRHGVRLALLAFNAVPDPAGQANALPDDWARADWDLESATAAVGAARAEADAVIVSIHWGYEYQLQADPAQRRLAQALLDAGADLVAGHHPHVVQETAVHDGRFLAYSLGNFLFDQGQGDTGQGLALRALFDAGGLLGVQALPVWAGPQPRLMPLDQAGPLLERIRPPLARVGFACSRPAGDVECRPTPAPQELNIPLRSAAPDENSPAVVRRPPSLSGQAAGGLFWSGEIDLTGDGRAELVRREGEQIVVYSDGEPVWRGLPEWRVVDLALGDPNDDGRLDAILALWKEDETGTPRSHPFIVGYRGGRYTLLWGGSAVAFPIHELELGDVTGDGAANLVVLEETATGQERTLSVWRWHGWGYTLLWRSPPGRYRDLILLPGIDGKAVISIAVLP